MKLSAACCLIRVACVFPQAAREHVGSPTPRYPVTVAVVRTRPQSCHIRRRILLSEELGDPTSSFSSHPDCLLAIGFLSAIKKSCPGPPGSWGACGLFNTKVPCYGRSTIYILAESCFQRSSTRSPAACRLVRIACVFTRAPVPSAAGARPHRGRLRIIPRTDHKKRGYCHSR